MHSPVWTLAVICGYLALLLALGFWASSRFRGGTKDYLLASHSIGPFLLLMSLFGTTMTAFALVGSTGQAYAEGIGVYGLMASSSGIIHSLCFFLVGVKVWSFGKKHGYTTQIGFFRDRLDNEGIGLLLFPILVGLVIPYLLVGVISAGAVVNTMTGVANNPEAGAVTFLGAENGGVPRHLASAIICLVVLIYVFFGGMRGTAWANAFQTLVFMVLGIVTFYVIAKKLGGGATFFEGLQSASSAVEPDKATRVDMNKAKFLTYHAHSFFGRHVPALVPALADSQERQELSPFRRIAPRVHYDRLGAVHSHRHLGDNEPGEPAAASGRKPQSHSAVLSEIASRAHPGWPAHRWRAGGDHVVAR